MEQHNYLVDTNAVIDYLANKLPVSGMNFMNSVVDSIPIISVITKIELLGFTTANDEYAILDNFVNDARIIELNNFVVEKTIFIRKQYKIKLPDAIIAATALVYDLKVVSRNVSDFSIENLEVINPHGL